MKKNKRPKINKEICIKWLKRNYIYLIMVALVGIRILIGYEIGAWFGMSETYDDMAMMQGLSIKRFSSPDRFTLIKDLSFSLFLGFSAITQLPFTIIMSCFWAFTALVVWFLVRKVSKNKWVQLFSFAYVLFLPIAFTSWGGLRIYRNAIIAPCIILTFSLILMVIIDLIRKEKLKKTIWTAIFAGLAFAFTYYLKEDGIWLMVCLLFAILVCAVIIFCRLKKDNGLRDKIKIKEAIVWFLVCAIPFGVWFVWGNIYKGVNYVAFGVYETNTRTNGELGKFVELVYKIDSPNRTKIVWAPYDAIQAAFDASPTLGSHPDLLENIMNTEWNEGGIIKNPIKYDFLGWVLRSGLYNTGMWTSERELNDLFGQINNELREAFKNGTLKKAEGRIQLLASTGGYTWDEIMTSNIGEQTVASIADSIWLQRYQIGFGDDDVYYGTKGRDWDYTKVNKVLHMEGDVNIVDKGGREFGKGMATIVCWIYRIENTVITIVMVVFISCQGFGVIKNWKKRKVYYKKNSKYLSIAFASFVCLGITLAYSFATAWFFVGDSGAEQLPYLFVFYKVGVPGLYTMAVLPACVGSFEWFIDRKN